jgi:hypothetical protein
MVPRCVEKVTGEDEYAVMVPKLTVVHFFSRAKTYLGFHGGGCVGMTIPKQILGPRNHD